MVSMTKNARPYWTLTWAGESRSVQAHDGVAAARAVIGDAWQDVDPVTGHGHRIGWEGDRGGWVVLYSDTEGSREVLVVYPADERPDSTERAVTEEARRLTHAAPVARDVPQVRADRDTRRMLALFVVVGIAVGGYVVGDRYGTPETCDPSTPGCSFVSDGVAWRTLSDGTAWQECRDEDGPGPCVWLADERGNGVGQSYTVGADGTVAPLP